MLEFNHNFVLNNEFLSSAIVLLTFVFSALMFMGQILNNYKNIIIWVAFVCCTLSVSSGWFYHYAHELTEVEILSLKNKGILNRCVVEKIIEKKEKDKITYGLVYFNFEECEKELKTKQTDELINKMLQELNK